MIEMSNPEETLPFAPTPPPRRWRTWGTVLVAIALFAAGVGAGFLFVRDNRGETPATTIATATTSAPVVTVPISSDEPAADVAEALLPSLVAIETDLGGGSGFIFDSAGLILTAAHVVDGAEEVTVRLADGERVEGRVVGANGRTDIAVVEIDRTGLPVAPLALDEEPRVGQMAIALGSPWGLDRTVTVGYVSAVNRSLPERGGARSLIQTDAPINPGNSGGPLADRLGRVIGINVSIFSVTGGNQGVGFAVPITAAKEVADLLVAGEPIERAFLGVSGTDPELGQAGALIEEVVQGSAAETAGLQAGDLVVSVDGVPVQGMIDLAAAIQSLPPGSVVALEVVRDGSTLGLKATLGTAQG